MTSLLNFFNFASSFISNHQLGCAFTFAVLIASLPKPGEPWTLYEVIYAFLNGMAANLPTKVRSRLGGNDAK